MTSQSSSYQSAAGMPTSDHTMVDGANGGGDTSNIAAIKATAVSGKTASAAVDAGALERLQRHRSYHFSSSSSQSRNHRSHNNKGSRFEAANNASDHIQRRTASVRVRPTFVEEDDDINLPQPPVSIQVASPDDDLQDVNLEANSLNHR